MASKKIIILDESVANQIAAGEVIERPASVVKELVENSIDAGSTRIQVEVVNGGRTSIRVIDNGEGINREDVVIAFERHATSKIREATDLFSIRTLGFRGEALPSIAAVSKVTLKTRTANEKVGTLLKLEGGEIKDLRDIGMAVGTDFLVEDLFYNTPARYKYLKTTTTELSQISDIFNRIAVAEPQIAMTLIHNGRLVSRTPGTGRMLDAILSIFGRELVDNLVEVDYEENYVKVWGYVTIPTVYRSSRKHQSFYVNGRFVRSTLLSRGVSEAYYNLLPPNRHPIVFLFVKINPVHVDVNVHPAKFEIRFSRPEIVMDVVTKGIRKALQTKNYLPTFKPMEKVQNRQKKKDELELSSLFEDDPGRGDSVENICGNDIDSGFDECREKNIKTGGDEKKENGDVIYTQDSKISAGRVAERLAKLGYQKKNWDPMYRSPESEYRTKDNQSQTGEANFSENSEAEIAINRVSDSSKKAGTFIANLRPIGQIHNTYIIAEGKDGFYVIDQHVAHERVLYEKLMESFRNKGLPSQRLLIPLTLELTLQEVQVIQKNKELFVQLGYEVENFGGKTVIVRSVPRRVDARSDKDLFLEIVDLLLEEKKVKDRARLYDKLITEMACKGAIKAGEYLEQGEMVKLLQDLSRTENPRFCPHGRPILFHISEQDLLKAFQRI
ncbi:hypothetical protein BBF96_04155 [Anoxybacter fermentans]|uniref:DNA mismatch repair protein MutL n=1 Tax=Anoxybacter fermentans TaxID=1323375 RepID=A0A3Q9HPF5_9FIRM|nr:DNA mismatch repair endonuclease MutL [Anoxybacter fermentans]AZR72652.1 hypothetical protein BBF96_04155 [Anoxybacter fermentans]